MLLLLLSVVSDSVRPHRQQPTRLHHPWDSPSKNTGVGCHFLLQCMKVKRESEVVQLCPTPSNPMDCSLPGSSIHDIYTILRLTRQTQQPKQYISDKGIEKEPIGETRNRPHTNVPNSFSTEVEQPFDRERIILPNAARTIAYPQVKIQILT